MMMKIFVSTVFLLLITTAAIAQTATTVAEGGKRGERSVSNNTRQWAYNSTDDGTELSIMLRNDVRFTDDYTDISRVGDDSSFQAREKSGGITRQLKIVAGANGQPVRTYSVNGKPRAFDAEGKQWLAKLLATAFASGLDASERARRIFAQQGARGVLDEIPHLYGDTNRRTYLEELVKTDDLDAKTLQQVFRAAAREIDSDYEKATFLINTAGAHRGNEDAMATYFAAIETIKADYEHARVLKALLKTKDVSKELLILTITSATKIGSDYEKANVLIEVAKTRIENERLRAALLDAIKTVNSDHERGRVLQAVYLNESK